APLKSIVSAPSPPSIVSLPSPGSQTKVSSPAPNSAASLPPLPSTESFPSPPSSVSIPLPPASVSFPSPPSIAVGMASVEAPVDRKSVVQRKRVASSACGGAVEEHRVGAVLALDGVAAVAGIPGEGVVAGAQQRQVVAAVAVDRVGAVAAEQELAALAAGDRVVSVSTVDRGWDGVGEGAVAVVDPHAVVAGPGINGDLRDLVAREAEIGRAVVAEVDLERAGIAGLQAKRDRVARPRPLDLQQAVLELRVLGPGVLARSVVGVAGGRGIPLSGRNPGRAGDERGRGHCRSRQPHGARVLESNE